MRGHPSSIRNPEPFVIHLSKSQKLKYPQSPPSLQYLQRSLLVQSVIKEKSWPITGKTKLIASSQIVICLAPQRAKFALYPLPMASPALLSSATSSFHGQFPAVPTLHSVRLPLGNPRTSLSVKASAVVLVDKTEAEKVHRLKRNYLEKVVPLLKEEFSYTNIHQVPKVEKIVVNCGIGDAAQNAKGLDAAVNDLANITGQRPIKTRAKKAIATFKIREKQPLGIAVTLRGKVMYSFLDRLINLGLPRTRDFQGVNPNSFDGHGNYSIGFREQSVFPEIRYDVLGKPRGMDVCITTTAKTDKEAHRLLALMGMPFREGGGPTTMMRKKKLKAHHFDSKSKGKGRR